MQPAFFSNDPPQLPFKEQSAFKKIALNYTRNKQQDNRDKLDELADAFDFATCREHYWNPEQFSLLYGTALWNGATENQRRALNQLYWVAYYCQIISAEIATIFLNQTAGAGLYALEDFRIVCDTLDLETAQERAHIDAFKRVSEAVESELFGERLFTYPMRPYYVETMIYQNSNAVKAFWKRLAFYFYTMLSSGSGFLSAQYFTVRGIRTLKGKMVQHQLSGQTKAFGTPEQSPVPTQISYHHFLDESFHFNSSTIISQYITACLKPPTKFEEYFTNLLIAGTQRDHRHVSVTVNGIFWYEPAVMPTIKKLLHSPLFNMSEADAREMLKKCYCEDSEGLQISFAGFRKAVESYKAYVANMPFVNRANKEMAHLSSYTIDEYLAVNRRALERLV